MQRHPPVRSSRAVAVAPRRPVVAPHNGATPRTGTRPRAGDGAAPAHPGEVLRGRLPPGVAVGELARRLGVTRQALSAVLNGRAGISAPMALRLEATLGLRAERWLRLQAAWDLWQARRRAPRPARRAAGAAH